MCARALVTVHATRSRVQYKKETLQYQECFDVYRRLYIKNLSSALDCGIAQISQIAQTSGLSDLSDAAV